MGHWEQIRGEVKLPAAEVPKMKKALRDAHNTYVEKVYDSAKEFWRENRTTSVKKYDEARRNLYARQSNQRRDPYGYQSLQEVEFAGDVNEVLDRIQREASSTDGSLRGVTWKDMERSDMAKKTNRDTEFRAGDGYIRVDDRVLDWDTTRDRHTIERFENSPCGKAMKQRLQKVEWTRGTGGVSRSDNEYANEAGMDYPMYGGSGPSLHDHYGPLGEEIYRNETGMWPPNSEGRRKEEQKRREREQRKAQRKREKEQEKKRVQQALASPQAAKFCGKPNKSKDGLCGRLLNGGECPDHGKTTTVVVVPGRDDEDSDTSKAAKAQPF